MPTRYVLTNNFVMNHINHLVISFHDGWFLEDDFSWTTLSSLHFRYSVDFDLKKLVEDSALDAKASRIEAKKQVKKVFEEKYKSQSVKVDRKAAGVSYFFNKLRF